MLEDSHYGFLIIERNGLILSIIGAFLCESEGIVTDRWSVENGEFSGHISNQ